MSRGTPVTTVRLPPRLLADVLAYLHSRDQRGWVDYMDLSGFIISAITLKLKCLKKSASKRRRKSQDLDCFVPRARPYVLGDDVSDNPITGG